MDIYMILMRLIHIFSGVIWVGYGFSMMLFISPALEDLGPEGPKFSMAIVKNKRFSPLISSVAGLTVLSGLLLYFRLFGHELVLNTGAGLALTIGGLAGILAFIEGIRLGKKQKALVQFAMDMGKKAPSTEQGAQMAEMGQKIGSSAAISTVLMVISLIGMTLSEYFAI